MIDNESPAYKWARRQEKIPTEVEVLREQIAALTKELDEARRNRERRMTWLLWL